MQLLCNAKLSAKLFVRSQHANVPIVLKAHGELLQQIARKDNNITSEDLLFSPPFDLTFHVITIVTRQ